jgi:hypothetical protein
VRVDRGIVDRYPVQSKVAIHNHSSRVFARDTCDQRGGLALAAARCRTQSSSGSASRTEVAIIGSAAVSVSHVPCSISAASGPPLTLDVERGNCTVR